MTMEVDMAIPAADVFARLLTPAQLARAEDRGRSLAARHLTLQQLRKARDLTQAKLGKALGKEQVAISQIEKRADMLLSTLRGYVEAMGGSLSLVVQFKDGDPVVLTGFGGEER
jgi:Helix-turn-helix domain